MNVPQFEGQVDTQWRRHAGEDRDMQLLSDFAFIDSRGVRWDAPAGRIINGASIPEVLWSKIVGTPYIGDYRRATVVHDVACQDKAKPHEEVHRMFYDAMLCDGVSEERAFLMYTAVRLFGPSGHPEQHSSVLAARCEGLMSLSSRRPSIRRSASTLAGGLTRDWSEPAAERLVTAEQDVGPVAQPQRVSQRNRKFDGATHVRDA